MEDVTEDFGKLKIDDETFLSPDSASTAFTHSSDESTSVSANVPRKKLNEFLQVSKIEPLGKPWLSWSSISDHSRQRQANKTTEIVAAVLKTISPDNTGDLWQRLASSTTMNKALGIDTISHSDEIYLEALAEAYHNASSWDTRRQILSIMAGVGSFNDISRYVPGLTKYRYSMANLHKSQFGRGGQVPKTSTTRI